MRLEMGEGNESREEIRAILKAWLERGENVPSESTSVPRTNSRRPTQNPPETTDVGGRYDFDLAEFPLFSLYKNRQSDSGRDPLIYNDTIKGQGGEAITRTWKVYPGAFGFGGSTAQLLLYDLLQLYCEQGARGSQIEFGTVRSLLMRRGVRHPSVKDYERVRRDIDILRGYDFHAKNAFYDRNRKTYIDMKWRLFGSVFYFKPSPDDIDQELPFGFIEVSPVLQQIAKARGFFSIGFKNELFYALKPMEQRLAVYLAKKFVSQKLHRRFVSDLVRALPIQTATEMDARKALKQATLGLVAKQVPIIADFRFEKSTTGKWLAVFQRKQAPKQDVNLYAQAGRELAPGLRDQIERIIEGVGSADDRAWWTQCVKRLGAGAVDRALGLLKEAKQYQDIRNPGGLLTWYFQKIAREYGVLLN
jgi:hypothetical protein